jgi:hypothetical protein
MTRAAILLVAATTLLFLGCKKEDAKSSSGASGASAGGRGEVETVLHHRSAEGAVFVTIETIEGYRHRITSLDLATGQPLARKVVPQRPDCVTASVGRLWCVIGDLQLLDVRTLATIADLGTLEKSEPLFASGVVKNGSRGLTQDRAVVLVTGDGQHVRIDPTTVGAARMGPSDPAPGYWGVGSSATTSEVRFGEVIYDFRGRGHDELMLLVDRNAPAEATMAATELAYPAFLAPSLVIDQTVGSAAILRDPPAVLVEHPSSLIAERSQDQLSLLELSGRVRWKIDPGGDLKLAATAGDTVVLALDARPDDLAVAIDLATGAVRWRFEY